MKVKLLKKLRRRGRDKITVISITRTNGSITGITYSYSDDDYKGFLKTCWSEEELLKKSERVYIKKYLELTSPKTK